MATTIKETRIMKYSKSIKGYFKLSDGTKTKFEIDKMGEWEQWGNRRDNLCITVPNVMRMKKLNEFSSIEDLLKFFLKRNQQRQLVIDKINTQTKWQQQLKKPKL